MIANCRIKYFYPDGHAETEEYLDGSVFIAPPYQIVFWNDHAWRNGTRYGGEVIPERLRTISAEYIRRNLAPP